MKDFKYIFGPMRPPFLILTPACVLLGFGTAIRTTGSISVLDAVLILIAAISTHISVNAFNEYYDFKSGLDTRTERTPFSGGSGTLPEKPAMARPALITALVAFVITILIGVYFYLVKQLPLLPLGVVGLFVIVAYTPWLTRRPLLCLIAPGLGFGILMVMGTHYVLTGEYTWTPFIASLIPFFLVSDLLLLNQFPDVDADQSIGRKHLPIAFGRHNSSLIYIFFLLFAYLAILLGVYFKYLPLGSLLGLVTIFIAIPVAVGAFRYAEDIKKLVPYMGLNVIISILTPALVAIGLFMR